MSNNIPNNIKKMIISLFLLLPFIVIVWTVNIVVDPANLVASRYAKQVAEIMASGQNATNIQNLDDRQLIREYASICKKDIDVLVLGSSRSMQVTPKLTGEKNTFCAGVTGADLRDSISTYLLFKDNGIKPKKVVLCAEYWFLSKGNLDNRAMVSGYRDFCKSTDNKYYKSDSALKTRVKELMSFSYFQSSIKFLLSEKKLEITATDNRDNVYATRCFDGSYSYEQKYRNGGVEQSEKYANDSIVSNLIAKYFSGVDENLQKQFEEFIIMMKNDGVDVEIQLSPFHPTYYDHMKKTSSYDVILSTENYFYSLENKLGISCYGSYNPHLFEMTNMDFYDAQHPTAEGIYKYYHVKNNYI